MARKSTKRTKDVLARDLAYVLNSPLHIRTKLAVFNNAAWAWTEFTGKRRGCPYWSKMAIMEEATASGRPLIHEHVVPRKVVFRLLSELQNPTVDDVHAILDRFLHAVIVTKEEDDVLSVEYRDCMPPEFDDAQSPDYQNPWLRYTRCGIEFLRR